MFSSTISFQIATLPGNWPRRVSATAACQGNLLVFTTL